MKENGKCVPCVAAWLIALVCLVASSILVPQLQPAFVMVVFSLLTSVLLFDRYAGLSVAKGGLVSAGIVAAYALLAIARDHSLWAMTGAFLDETSLTALGGIVIAALSGELAARRYGMMKLAWVASIASLVLGMLSVGAAIAGSGALEPLLPESRNGIAFAIGIFSSVYLLRQASGPRALHAAVIGVSGFMVVAALLPQTDTWLSRTPDILPNAYQTYELLSATWAAGSHEALIGIGPRRFADAWHAYRPWDADYSVFWNQEPQHGRSFLLTIAVEYGLLGLWWLLAMIVALGVRLFRSDPSQLAIAAHVTAAVLLIVSMPSTITLICGAFALGAYGAKRSVEPLRIFPRITVLAFTVSYIVFVSWFAVSILLATMSARSGAWRSLEPWDFERYAASMTHGLPAPFATVYGLEAGLRRAYVQDRLQNKQSVIIETESRSLDVLADLQASIRRSGEAQSGIRPALSEAQTALWAADAGRDTLLSAARINLTSAIEGAPLHIVGRILTERLQRRQGDVERADAQQRTIRYMTEALDLPVDGL